MKKCLFIFAHLDDETILSYGTMAKFAAQGVECHVCCLCGAGRLQLNGKMSRQVAFYQNTQEVNAKGICHPFYDLTLARDTVQPIVSEVVAYVQPDIVVTHSTTDMHYEHRLVADIVMVSCRRIEGCTIKKLLMTASPTSNWTYGQFGHFSPNLFIDVSDFAKKKIEALKRYGTEIPSKMCYDNRSIDSIMCFNQMHGNTVGCQYAEPYYQVFEVV